MSGQNANYQTRVFVFLVLIVVLERMAYLFSLLLLLVRVAHDDLRSFIYRR